VFLSQNYCRIHQTLRVTPAMEVRGTPQASKHRFEQFRSRKAVSPFNLRNRRYERTVDRDNTVSFYNVIMQLERAEWRPTLAGCKVIVHQHLDQTLTLMIAGHRVGHYSAEGKLLTPLTKKQIKVANRNTQASKSLRSKVEDM
jgi:hypothetical protein